MDIQAPASPNVHVLATASHTADAALSHEGVPYSATTVSTAA